MKAVLSDDTSRDAEDVQVELWRAMSARDKAALVTALCRSADQMAMAGVRRRHPGASDRECFLRLASLKLGSDLARRVYPDIEDLDDLA